MSISQSCLAVCNPMNCSPPGSSVHGFLQARILEWDAIPFSRGSSWPRDFLHCRHTLYPLSHQGSQPNLEFRRMLLSSCVRNGLEGEGLVGRLAKAQESEGHAEGVWAWTGLFSQTREPAGGVEWEGPRGGTSAQATWLPSGQSCLFIISTFLSLSTSAARLTHTQALLVSHLRTVARYPSQTWPFLGWFSLPDA